MDEQATDRNCPNCAMPLTQGSQPTVRNGVTYCCEACADGGQCTCSGHSHA